MATSNKQDALIKLMLEYDLDEKSLDKALSEAEKKYKASKDKTYQISKKSAEKIKAEALRQKKAELAKTAELEQKADTTTKTRKKSSFMKVMKDRFAIFKSYLLKEEVAEKKSQEKRKGFSDGFKNFGGKVGTISSYGAAIAIINAVRQAVTYAVEKVIEFEVAFTDLAVKSGYTNKQMAKTTDTIMEVAQATHFSTLEIVSAATALGKLGFEADDVVEILPNLANVAAATGESLQNTAEILGKVINAYEFTAEQSGIISDRMVDIFNNSALNLEKFNTAFSYVGSAAASTGTSFDELTAAMAILADRGITASKIGTGLRNVFTKLGTEGDSLRDILERISDAHLSFYEVAELVGRRAANQLFIMADSLDEFDDNVARSADDFGSSMIAASKQMDTFKSKWDIFINTITNQVAAPEFDPDSQWRDAIAESIDLMDVWNSLWNEGNSFASIRRLINLYPEFRDEFKKVKEELGTEGELDDNVLDEMADRAMTAAEAYEEGSKEWWRVINYAKALRRANLTMTDESQAVTMGLADYDKEKLQDEAEQAVLDWDTALSGAIKKVGARYGSDAKDNFITAYFYGGDYKKALEKLKKDGYLSDDDIKTIVEGTQYRTTQVLQKYRVANSGTYVEALEKQYGDAQKKIRDLNNGSLEFDKKTLEEDAGLIQGAIDHEKKIAKEICDKYPRLANKLGIICESVRTYKKRGEIGEFELNEKARSEYESEKDRLTKEYRLEDDPIKKADINQKLIELEFTYRDQLNDAYEKYLKEQARLRDDFVKKYPDQADDFDSNVKSNENAQIRSITAGNKNMNTYELRALEDTAKEYEQNFNLRQGYLERISALDLKYKHPSTDTPEKRRKILEERNQVTKDYYKVAEENLGIHYEKMQKEYEKLQKKNEEIVKAGGTPIDLSGIASALGDKNGMLSKLRTERNKALKPSPDPDDDDADFDYFGEAMIIYENVADVFNQLGQAKLEMLKEQVAAELEVIQGRYDDEMSIVNSALDSGIISQENAFAAEEKLKKKKLAAENAAEKKLFEAQKKQDSQEAILSGIAQTAQAVARAFAEFPTPVAAVMAAVSAAAVAAASATNVATIAKRKFIPKKYEEGGLVEGRSHAQGGIPFTIAGKGGFEMEGGEYIVNKRAAKEHLAELERINGKTSSNKRRWADGGQISADVTDTEFNALLLEALSKPVRAYITDQDLARSESERNALTKKITY